jgi:hypothetical protein
MTQHAKHEHDMRALRRRIEVLELENERLSELLPTSVRKNVQQRHIKLDDI